MTTAIIHLEKAARFNRDLLLALCDAYRETGNTTALNRTLDEAYAVYKAEAAAKPKDESSSVKFAIVALQLDKLNEAKELLESRFNADSSEKLKLFLSQVYVQEFDKELKSPDRKVRIDLLTKAVKLDPVSEHALSRLAQIHGSRYDSKSIAEALRSLRNWSGRGIQVPTTTFRWGLLISFMAIMTKQWSTLKSRLNWMNFLQLPATILLGCLPISKPIWIGR